MVTLNHHIVRYTASSDKEVVDWAHIEAWLIANCTGEMSTLPGPGMDQVDIIFDNEQDAFLWMLAWGGEHLRPRRCDLGGFTW